MPKMAMAMAPQGAQIRMKMVKHRQRVHQKLGRARQIILDKMIRGLTMEPVTLS